VTTFIWLIRRDLAAAMFSGVPNIKDRAERLGGVLRITSSPGAGTTLDIKVPVPVPTAWLPLV